MARGNAGWLAQSADLRLTFNCATVDRISMPIYGRHFERGQMQFITASYRVTVRLVASTDQWPWSSFRFYYLEDSSVLAMDRIA
jgi:hypothetical protein